MMHSNSKEEGVSDLVKKLQSRINYKGINFDTPLEQIISEYGLENDAAVHIKNSISTRPMGTFTKLNEGSVGEILSSIRNSIEEASKSKVDGVFAKTAIVDSFLLAKIKAIALSQVSNLTDKQGNRIGIGSAPALNQKLEVMAKTIGIEGVEKLAHGASFDTLMNQPVMESLLTELDAIIEAKGGSLSVANIPNSAAFIDTVVQFSDNQIISENNLKASIMDIIERDAVDPSADKYFNTGPRRMPIDSVKSVEGLVPQILNTYSDYDSTKGRKLISDTMKEYAEELESYGTIAEKEKAAFNIKNKLNESSKKITNEIIDKAVNTHQVAPRPPHSTIISSTDAMLSFKNSAVKGGLVIAGLIAASTLISGSTNSYEKEIHSTDDDYQGDYSPIEKLQRINIQPTNPFQTANSYQTASFFKRKGEFQSTAGIGLEMSNNMTNHYVM